jgi:hypothetical protein
MPLDRSNRVALYQAKVKNNIIWTVYDIDKRTVVKHKVAKLYVNSKYCLKHLGEMKPGEYLLSIEAMKPNEIYVIYNEANSQEPLRPLKTVLDEKTFEIMSVGLWLYIFEFNLNANG